MTHTLSHEQTQRLDRLKSQWNYIRGDQRREAAREELIDYLLQREEDELRAMREAEDREPIPYQVERLEVPNLNTINDLLSEQFARTVELVDARALAGLGV